MGLLATVVPMQQTSLRVLAVGATGSVGGQVVARALERGHRVRALVRRADQAHSLPGQVETVIADLTAPETLAAAVEGVDAVVFTHGTHPVDATLPESVDYGGVRNVLTAIGDRPVRIALMTAIGVTDRQGAYNRTTQAHDWKRRAERLVRASGHPYTIVRPGWFDYNSADQHNLVFLQGDRRRTGSPRDGVIARAQIGQVLVDSLTSPAAAGKTLELVAEHGPAQTDLDPLFAALVPDGPDRLDGALDEDTMPLESEPVGVRAELARIRAHAHR